MDSKVWEFDATLCFKRTGLEFSLSIKRKASLCCTLVISTQPTVKMAIEEPEIDKLQQLLIWGLVQEAGLSKRKAGLLAAHFATLDEFLEIRLEALAEIRSLTGRRMLLLTREQLESIDRFRTAGILHQTLTVSENLLTLVTRSFVRKQARMLDEITLDRLSPNPFLIKCLNLKTVREVVELNIYMFATRSIVTSMGFFIETLLIASSDNASKCDKPWDILKTADDGGRSWIQIKSGPNDMDADQIRFWSGLIANKVATGDNAYIGITYGKRSSSTVTIGLFRTYLPEWERRTLIGRELWDFISEDPAYHQKIFPLLAEAASRVLGTDSIEARIQQSVDRVTEEFHARYGKEEGAIEKYLADIF